MRALERSGAGQVSGHVQIQPYRSNVGNKAVSDHMVCMGIVIEWLENTGPNILVRIELGSLQATMLGAVV